MIKKQKSAKNSLLPVPTNEEYNRCLKEMGKEIDFKLLTEKGRERVALGILWPMWYSMDNGVPLKTIGKIPGQKSIRTTEKYVRPSKQNICENMHMVKQKLFDNMKVAAWQPLLFYYFMSWAILN